MSVLIRRTCAEIPPVLLLALLLSSVWPVGARAAAQQRPPTARDTSAHPVPRAQSPAVGRVHGNVSLALTGVRLVPLGAMAPLCAERDSVRSRLRHPRRDMRVAADSAERGARARRVYWRGVADSLAPVVAAASVPVPGADAAIINFLSASPVFLTTPAGQYDIDGVEAGRYLLYATADQDHSFWLVPVEVRTSDHTVDLSRRNASTLPRSPWTNIVEVACELVFQPAPEVDVPAGITAIPPELLNREELGAEIGRRYPPLFRSAGVFGDAVVRLRVLADGTVDPYLIEVVSASHESFGDAAALAAETMRFHPARIGGHPVAAWVTVPVTFQLR